MPGSGDRDVKASLSPVAVDSAEIKANAVTADEIATDAVDTLEIKDNAVVHTETLLTKVARFRDIETGPAGEIYVLLEHTSGGRIIRLVPTESMSIYE